MADNQLAERQPRLLAINFHLYCSTTYMSLTQSTALWHQALKNYKGVLLFKITSLKCDCLHVSWGAG